MVDLRFRNCVNEAVHDGQILVVEIGEEVGRIIDETVLVATSFICSVNIAARDTKNASHGKIDVLVAVLIHHARVMYSTVFGYIRSISPVIAFSRFHEGFPAEVDGTFDIVPKLLTSSALPFCIVNVDLM